MAEWIILGSRELTMLCVLSALGSGVVVRLPRTGDYGSRAALAPVFGLAIGCVLLTTAAFLIPMKTAAWVVLIPATILSLGSCLHRLAGERGFTAQLGPRLLSLAPLALVLVLVAFAFSFPLASRGSVGPLGYLVNDSTGGYPAQAIGLETNTLHESRWGPDWDLTAAYGASWAHGFQQVGYDPVVASVAALFDWHVIDSQSAFLIALVLIGACGVFATIRAFTRTAGWIPGLGALLYGGPLTYQLFIDGSQAALAGLALIAPIALLGARMLDRPGRVEIACMGVLLAGLQTLYPLIFPAVVLAIVAVVLALGLRAFLRATLSRRHVLRVAKLLAALGGLSIALSPVAFARNVEYWRVVAGNEFLPSLLNLFPQFSLPFQVIPGWLLQLRSFPYFAVRPVDHSFLSVLGQIAPVTIVLGIIGLGIVRYRRAWVLVALAACVALVAARGLATNDCVYCMQRNLLAIGVVGVVGVALGVSAVWSKGTPLAKGSAVAIGVVVLSTAALAETTLMRRAVDGGYAPPAQLRSVLGDLPGRRGAVQIEGAGASFQAVHELPATYYATSEATDQRVSLIREDDDHAGLWALGGPQRSGATFDPDYHWVVTRIPGVATARRVVARDGPYALEERRAPLDVTVTSGIVVDKARSDPAGRAWIEGLLKFWVSSTEPAAASIRLAFAGRGDATVVFPPATYERRIGGGKLTACVPVGEVTGKKPVSVALDFKSRGPRPSGSSFDWQPKPSRQIALTGMWATETACPTPVGRPRGHYSSRPSERVATVNQALFSTHQLSAIVRDLTRELGRSPRLLTLIVDRDSVLFQVQDAHRPRITHEVVWRAGSFFENPKAVLRGDVSRNIFSPLAINLDAVPHLVAEATQLVPGGNVTTLQVARPGLPIADAVTLAWMVNVTAPSGNYQLRANAAGDVIRIIEP